MTRNKCNILNLFKCKRYKPCKVQHNVQIVHFFYLLLSLLPVSLLPFTLFPLHLPRWSSYSKMATFWLITLLCPIFGLRIAGCSAFLNYLRKILFKNFFFFFQACWKGFCNMAWENINVIQHVFDKKKKIFELFAIYCTVHGNLFSFFLTF